MSVKVGVYKRSDDGTFGLVETLEPDAEGRLPHTVPNTDDDTQVWVAFDGGIRQVTEPFNIIR